MALMIPSRYPFTKDRKRRAERIFFDACDEQLGPSWTVLFGVEWNRPVDDRTLESEIDFLVLHPTIGILLIEVKGGEEIRYLNESSNPKKHHFVSRPHQNRKSQVKTRFNPIKDPFKQSRQSVWALRKYLCEQLPHLSTKIKPAIGSLVAFPGARQSRDQLDKEAMGPNAFPDIICDRDDLNDLPNVFKKAAKHWNLKQRLSAKELDQIREKVCLSVNLIGSMRLDLEAIENQIDELTDTQLSTWAWLRRIRELTILGGAGTGKTVLAFHRAKELASQGIRTIYLCHSDALATDLIKRIPKNDETLSHNLAIMSQATMDLHFFYSYVQRTYGADLAHRLEDARNQRNSSELDKYFEYYSEFYGRTRGGYIEDLHEMAIERHGTVGALIVDEAQLVGYHYLSLIRRVVQEPGYFYLFGDPNQRWWSEISPLGRENISALEGFGSPDPEWLTINCRATYPICRFANELVRVASAPRYIDGFEPEIVKAPAVDWVDAVAEIVHRWIKDFEVDPSDIALLVEPDRLFEGIWGNSQETKGFVANNSGITYHEGFAIDWWSCYHLLLSETQVSFLTKGKSYLPSHHPRSPGESFFAYYGGIEPRQTLGGIIASEDFDRFREEFIRERESVSQPLIVAQDLFDFVGLEKKAVIALNPILDTDNFGGYLNELYTMTTRAQALLAVVISPETDALLPTDLFTLVSQKEEDS